MRGTIYRFAVWVKEFGERLRLRGLVRFGMALKGKASR